MPLDQPLNKKGAVPPLVITVLSIMSELIDIMAKEPELVLTRKFDAHAALLKRKQKLTMEYRSVIKALSAQPETLAQIPDDVRRRLKTMGQQLSETSDRNARTLRAAVTAVQRLIQNIVAFVKSEVLATPGYTNPNNGNRELNAYSPTCKPVAVSRSA